MVFQHVSEHASLTANSAEAHKRGFTKYLFLIKQTLFIIKMDYSLIERDLEETPEGEVYFIFRKNKSRKCKIGKSINPKKRKKELQTGNHRELYVYKTLYGYDRLETMLHEHFDEHRIRKTEWFDITFEDVDEIIEQYYEVKVEKAQMFRLNRNNEEDESDIDESIKDEKDEFDVDEKDNILDNKTIELVEETETTIIKKKVYKNMDVYKCSDCNQTFSDEKYLTRHVKAKTCTKHHVCSKCDKEFSSAYNLRSHLKRKTACVPETVPVINIKLDENKCIYCGKCYSSSYNLKRHAGACPMKNNQAAMMKLVLEQNKILMDREQKLFEILEKMG